MASRDSRELFSLEDEDDIGTPRADSKVNGNGFNTNHDGDDLSEDEGASVGSLDLDVPLLSDMDEPTFLPRRSTSTRVHVDLEGGFIKHPNEGGGMIASFLNMANSIIGAGIIGLPFSFREAGFFMGIILLIILTLVVDWTIRLIVYNAKLSGRSSYQDVMNHCFGKPGKIAIAIFQFAFAFGGMCAFCVIIGDTIPHVVSSLFPFILNIPVINLFANRQFVIILCTACVSFPLSLYRDISKLSRASALALVSMLIIVISVAVEGPHVPDEYKGDPHKRFSIINPEIFQAIGVISFAFVCHHNSLLIYGSLRKPTLDRFAQVTHISTGISLVACLFMALTGYLVFTDKTAGNILNNFPQSNLMINIARFCFGFNMFTTLPLEAFVCREVIEGYFYADVPFDKKRHVIVTSVLVFSAMLLSLLTCDLGLVLELTGGFSATALAFILPPLCFIQLGSGKWYERKKWGAVACIAFGAIVMVLSTVLAVTKALGGTEPRQCT